LTLPGNYRTNLKNKELKMGNYISVELLEERVTENRLNSLCRVTGLPKDSLLENVTTRAEGLIDAYAAVRYKVPLPAVELVEEWSLSIAEYELYKRGSGGDVPRKIKDSYAETLEMLAELASGKIDIPSAEKQNAFDSGLSVMFDSSEPVMKGDTFKGW
jgi:phage gp36-like protein